MSRSPRQAGIDRQLANVQAPHLEVVNDERAHPPASHRKCADGETSDGDRTKRRAPKRQRSQGRRANSSRTSCARLNLSYVSPVNLPVVHGAPRSLRLISESHSSELSTHRNPDMPELGSGAYVSLIHISEPTRLLSISYAVFCLKKKKKL